MTRPHLTDARVTAGQTYKRRRARTAADELLSIPPGLWDDHTRRIVLVTLPSLIYARELARYGEPGAICSRPSCGNPPCVDCTSAGIPPYRPDGSLQACPVEIAGDVMCGEAQPCAAHPPLTDDQMASNIAAGRLSHDNGGYRA